MHRPRLLLLGATIAHQVSFRYQGPLDLAQRARRIPLLLDMATRFAPLVILVRMLRKVLQVAPRVMVLSQPLDAKFVLLANMLVPLAAKVVELELVLVVELSLVVPLARPVHSVLTQTEPLV